MMYVPQLAWHDHLLIAVVLVLMSSALLRRNALSEQAGKFTTRDRIGTYLGNGLVLWALAGFAVSSWLGAGRTLDALGFRPPFATGVWWTLLLLIAFWVWFAWESQRELGRPEKLAEARRRYRDKTPFMPTTVHEFAWWILLAISAGICEEVVFRGYLIPYFIGWFGDSPLGILSAVAVPAVIFGVSHIYQGPAAVLKIVLLSLLFGAILVISGSIIALMIAHSLLDILQGLFGLWWLTPSPGSEESLHREGSTNQGI